MGKSGYYQHSCHAERSYGSLSWSSTGTITRVVVWLHLPAAPYLVLIICHTCRLLPGLFNQSSGTGPVRSLVLPWQHFRAFSLVWLSVYYLDCWLSWSFAACLTDPACLLDILSVCRLPWPLALPLFTNLPCLRCPRYYCLLFACLTTSLY